MLEPNHVHTAEVTQVHDGDTFWARVELDFGVRIDIRVRVKDLWEPELDTPEGIAARDALIDLLRSYGNIIVLQSYKDTMSFARWVCDVWLPSGVKLVGGEPPVKKLGATLEELYPV